MLAECPVTKCLTSDNSAFTGCLLVCCSSCGDTRPLVTASGSDIATTLVLSLVTMLITTHSPN